MQLTAPSSAAAAAVGTTSAPESLLVRYIKAHVRKGDQAKDKSEQHYIAAGRYLITLKANYAPSWEAWEDLLRIKVGLSTGRASELMQIADGRKDLQQIRDGKAQSVRQLRAQRSSVRREENIEPIDSTQAEAVLFPTPKPVKPVGFEVGSLLGRFGAASEAAQHRFRQLLDLTNNPTDPNCLIDVLGASDAATRSAAANALITGSRQSQFERVRDAVADLYQKIAGAGR